MRNMLTRYFSHGICLATLVKWFFPVQAVTWQRQRYIIIESFYCILLTRLGQRISCDALISHNHNFLEPRFLPYRMKIIYSFLFSACCNKNISRKYIVPFSYKCKTIMTFLGHPSVMVFRKQCDLLFECQTLVQYFFLCSKIVSSE